LIALFTFVALMRDALGVVVQLERYLHGLALCSLP
jgi:hypothetical protein